MKELFSGENHWNWNKDKSEEERVNRRHIDGYKDFIRNVLDRDNYTCQCCEVHSHDLEVHHLDGYDWCISGRIDVKNGIALCDKCHSNFHSKYGYGQNTKLQFEEWFGQTIQLIEHNCEITKSRLIICLESNEINEVGFFVKKYNNKETRIYRCCNKKEKTAKGKHYLWHDEYINMSENDLKDYLQWSLHDNAKAIICLNTKEIFYKMTDARNKYNIHSHSLLTKCCKGIANYAGIHPITEEKLKWMYLIDYLN
jgi:hypothetical protein